MRKLLVLSQNAWRGDNSFGSSYNNIFKTLDDVAIANVYCDTARPENDRVSAHFRVSERALAKKLFDKGIKTGEEVKPIKAATNPHDGTLAKPALKKLRWQIFFWARDLLWMIGRWRTKELDAFIDDWDADVLFFPLYAQNYMCKVGRYIARRTNKPLILYVSDDVYTFRQFSLSPFYWLNRIVVRANVRRLVQHCKLLYVISDVQKKDYERILRVPCKVLTKGDAFKGEAPIKQQVSAPLKLVFTGNIGGERWRLLAMIAGALQNINADGTKAVLNIYTFTPLTPAMQARLNRPNTSVVLKGVPANRVADIQAEADVLVHVEAFGLKERLKARQSFSTKIVDYFSAARCIFAVGSSKVASISHLITNDAAVVATSPANVQAKLSALVSDPKRVKTYGKKGWQCGKSHHGADAFNKMLSDDIDSVIARK